MVGDYFAPFGGSQWHLEEGVANLCPGLSLQAHR